MAVYDTYDDLGSLVKSLCKNNHLAPPLKWLVEHVALPVASAHAGTDLARFAPADVVDTIAPRPLLVIHARGDEVIPFDHGLRLFQRASQPRIRFWVGTPDKKGHFFDRQGMMPDHNNVIYNDDAAKAVRLFFEDMEPML